jgi:hypothetical protein
MSTHTSVLSARVFLQRRQQSRISSFNSPRLSRMVDDLREDPEKRAALDRRVRNTQAQATPRRAQPPTAREQLLAELHQQAAQEEAQALEVAPEVGLAGPLAAEQETTNDPADADADGPDVPQWGADDEPAPAAAPAATAARSRPSPRVAMLCRPKAWPPLPPPLPATPWAAELVARARGHYITAPEELLLNATVRARDKGRELHGQARPQPPPHTKEECRPPDPRRATPTRPL